MKHLLKTSLMALLCSGLLLGACKRRDKDMDISDADSVALAANADDEAASSDGNDMALEDADQLFNNASQAGGRVAALCGVSSVDTTSVPNQRTITFDGQTACGNRGVVRSGSITVQLVHGERWSDVDAVLLVNLNNYGRRKPNGRTVVMNGIGKIYNVTGGLRRQLSYERNLIQHRVRFNDVQVTYNGHRFANWSTAKTRTLTITDSVNKLEVKGDTTLIEEGQIGAWGTGRNGESFYTQFQQPVVYSSACEGGPVSGKKFHNGFRRDLTVTFGVDRSGNPVVSPACPYGFKFDFVGPRRTESGVIAY